MTDLLEPDGPSSSARPRPSRRGRRRRLRLGSRRSSRPSTGTCATSSTLTAVDRFSQHHDADVLPAQARYYQDLMPIGQPGAGQQYAFEVDLDSCSGCKACVTACHRLNGLDDGEAFRSVGTLVGTEAPALDLSRDDGHH